MHAHTYTRGRACTNTHTLTRTNTNARTSKTVATLYHFVQATFKFSTCASAESAFAVGGICFLGSSPDSLSGQVTIGHECGMQGGKKERTDKALGGGGTLDAMQKAAIH